MEVLPSYFSNNIMPIINTNQLQNKITRISLQHMYNYESTTTESFFRKNCYLLWNSLPLDIKSLPYLDKNCSLKKFNKFSLDHFDDINKNND